MSILSSIKVTTDRLKAPTPSYFLKWSILFNSIAVVATALSGYAELHPGFMQVMENAHIYTACQYVIAASISGVFVSHLAVEAPVPVVPVPEKIEIPTAI